MVVNAEEQRTIKTTRRGGQEKSAQRGFDRADIVRDYRLPGLSGPENVLCSMGCQSGQTEPTDALICSWSFLHVVPYTVYPESLGLHVCGHDFGTKE